MKLLILLSAIILASCATTIPVVVKLPLPPELTLPKIDGVALQCVSNEAYSNLVLRDKLQTQRRITLRGIIESSHN